MTALGAHCRRVVGRAVRGARRALARRLRSPARGSCSLRSVPARRRARAVDEEVPLKHGVLGQETTGPGGFAMALRTIPAMVGYARLIEEVAPNALLVNFTNPVGIVMQALHDHTERPRGRDLRRTDLDATQRGRVPGRAARAARMPTTRG